MHRDIIAISYARRLLILSGPGFRPCYEVSLCMRRSPAWADLDFSLAGNVCADPDNLDGLVFGILDNVKRSLAAARTKAGLSDVRFHDLRHTAATRLVGAHIPLSEVGRVLGHTQANTTYRYVNANVESAKRAAAALNMFNSEGTAEPESAEMVN